MIKVLLIANPKSGILSYEDSLNIDKFFELARKAMPCGIRKFLANPGLTLTVSPVLPKDK